jgi:hypothetical protein
VARRCSDASSGLTTHLHTKGTLPRRRRLNCTTEGGPDQQKQEYLSARGRRNAHTNRAARGRRNAHTNRVVSWPRPPTAVKGMLIGPQISGERLVPTNFWREGREIGGSCQQMRRSSRWLGMASCAGTVGLGGPTHVIKRAGCCHREQGRRRTPCALRCRCGDCARQHQYGGLKAVVCGDANDGIATLRFANTTSSNTSGTTFTFPSRITAAEVIALNECAAGQSRRYCRRLSERGRRRVRPHREDEEGQEVPTSAGAKDLALPVGGGRAPRAASPGERALTTVTFRRGSSFWRRGTAQQRGHPQQLLLLFSTPRRRRQCPTWPTTSVAAPLRT